MLLFSGIASFHCEGNPVNYFFVGWCRHAGEEEHQIESRPLVGSLFSAMLSEQNSSTHDRT
jgi:hypothetical protein